MQRNKRAPCQLRRAAFSNMPIANARCIIDKPFNENKQTEVKAQPGLTVVVERGSDRPFDLSSPDNRPKVLADS